MLWIATVILKEINNYFIILILTPNKITYREMILLYGYKDRDTDIDLDVEVAINTDMDIDKDMTQINKSSSRSSIILRIYSPKIIVFEKCDIFIYLHVLCHICLPQ